MEKREEKPKRNLKKGLTKPKTRHQRSVKKRKRDLKSEQKKRRGAERLSEKRIKKIVCCSRIKRFSKNECRAQKKG